MKDYSKMSKDRVRFTLTKEMLCSPRTRTVAQEVFGENLPLGYSQRGPAITVICRLSQFARFLIARSHAGSWDNFKDLRAELFVQKDVAVEWDVSQLPPSRREFLFDACQHHG